MLILTALRNLSRNRRRTSTILVIVGIGVASLFIMDGFNAGIMRQYRENTIHARFGYGVVYAKGYRQQAYERPWEHWIRGYAGFRDQVLRAPGVTSLFPRVSFWAFLTNGTVTVSGKGEGVDGEAEFPFFTTLNFVEGRNLSSEEDGIALGRGMARALRVHPGDAVTVLVRSAGGAIGAAALKVTGVFFTGLEEFDNSAFRIPLEKAQALIGTDRIESVAVGLDSGERWDGLARFLENGFPGMEPVSFAVLDEVYYQHSVDWLASQFGVIRLIILAMMILGTLNTVSTAVLERKQEIGNLKANGESAGDVVRLLCLEALTLGILGAALGLALSLLVVHVVIPNGIYMPPAPGLTRRFWVTVELQPAMAVVSLALGAGCTFLASLFAGLKVARMPIAEALRSP